MIRARPVADERAGSVLGRTSPLVKLGIGFAWLLGLAFTPTHLPPLVIAAVTLAAGILLGRIGPLDLARALVPLWSVALVVVVTNRQGDMKIWRQGEPEPDETEDVSSVILDG